MSARRVIISGRVQGVGFRDWMCAKATALGLHGWVRNRMDGSVEALIHGHEDAVEELLRACRKGPRMAVVLEVHESFAEPPEHVGFLRWPSA